MRQGVGAPATFKDKGFMDKGNDKTYSNEYHKRWFVHRCDNAPTPDAPTMTKDSEFFTDKEDAVQYLAEERDMILSEGTCEEEDIVVSDTDERFEIHRIGRGKVITLSLIEKILNEARNNKT